MALRDTQGRPLVAVTGMGVVTSLGQGKDDTWAALTAGNSGIHRISRFPTEGLRTTIAGTIDFVDVEPFCAPMLSERLATLAAEEAVGQSGLGARAISRARCSSPCPRSRWNGRSARRSPRPPARTATSPTRTFSRPPPRAASRPWHDLFIFGTVADRVADRFGTKGSPISLSTACSSGATAIQLGVEAIRRGETDAALCIGTDGSVNPESLIRFSLLSALSTQNENPRKARRSRSPRTATASSWARAARRSCWRTPRPREGARRDDPRLRARLRREGRRLPPHPLRARTARRSSRRSARRFDDAGLTPDEIDYINAHGTSTPENDKMEAMGCMAVFGERMARCADLLEQVDDRPHADRGGRGRGGVVAADHPERPHSADDQLHRCRTRRSRSTWCRTSPAMRR